MTARSDWMAGIPDTTPIHDIVIPGTHDSATFNRADGNYDKCQDKTIYEQLTMGIRFLDIRLRWFINTSAPAGAPASQLGNFTVYHSSNWQYVYFDEDSWISPSDSGMKNFPLQDCLRFLEENPSETIIMQVKKEYWKNDAEKHGFAQAFKDMVARHDPNGTKFYVGTTVPTMEQAKGRIVIVNRDGALGYGYAQGSGYGIRWTWPDDKRGVDSPGYLYVEDNYADTTSAAKEANIKRALDKAVSRPVADTTWVVTFVSCAPGNASPYSWASSMNPYVAGYVKDEGTGSKFGTVVMDFPPDDLVGLLLTQYTD